MVSGADFGTICTWLLFVFRCNYVTILHVQRYCHFTAYINSRDLKKSFSTNWTDLIDLFWLGGPYVSFGQWSSLLWTHTLRPFYNRLIALWVVHVLNVICFSVKWKMEYWTSIFSFNLYKFLNSFGSVQFNLCDVNELYWATHFTVPWRLEGWVGLGTAVRVRSPFPRLYIVVAVVVNTTVRYVIRSLTS